jgi:Fe-coproporphyrin III synthase
VTSAPPRLPILILFPHSRCNCRCVMCDIWKEPDRREIGAEELERHVDAMRSLGVEWVVFSGGEPLMHSDLFRLCAVLRPLSVRTTILSSGLLLKRHARRIVDEVGEVIVSLDGPPEVHQQIRGVPRAFEMLAEGVRALHELDPRYPVGARSTVQKLNHARLVETADTARAVGVESISFLAADLTSTAFNRPTGWPQERCRDVALTAAEIDVLSGEVERLLPDAGGFVKESPEKLRRIARHFRAHLELAEPEAPRCNAPWVSAVVESDGTVRPCFFHEPIGNLRDEALAAVWNGPRAVSFREGLNVAENPVCRRCVCSLYRGDQSTSSPSLK